MKFQEYHPPHIYIPNTIYFITSKVIGIPNSLVPKLVESRTCSAIFNTDQKLQTLLSILQNSAKHYNVLLYGWTLLSNHNHLLTYMESKNQIISFIKSFHGKSAIEINKMDNTPGRKVWYQYWDRCIRSEKDFWVRLNYIHHNCVKHGYVKDMFSYKFSSMSKYLIEHGKEWVNDCFKEYPVIDFTPEDGLE